MWTWRKLGDFVQEKCSSPGLLEEAGTTTFLGAGKGAALVSEQFAFQQRIRNSGTINGNKRPQTVAFGMDRPGEQFFTGSTFASDRNDGRCRGNLAGKGNGLDDRRCVAHKVIEGDVFRLRDLFDQCFDLLHVLHYFNGSGNPACGIDNRACADKKYELSIFR